MIEVLIGILREAETIIASQENEKTKTFALLKTINTDLSDIDKLLSNEKVN